MPRVVVPLNIKFFQTSDVISANQANFHFDDQQNTSQTTQTSALHQGFFIFPNTTCFA